jgi:hypothetical protein
VNAYNALVMAETAIWITSRYPPDGAIDARQPSEPNGDDPDGWDTFTLTFSGDVSDLTDEDFTIEVEGGGLAPGIDLVLIRIPPSSLGEVEGSWPPRGIDSVVPSGENTVTVLLDSMIPLVAWTTIRHDYSGTSDRIAHLPADVNGDGTSNPADILALVDALNGVIDRDGGPEPADILRLIELLDGEGVYDVYLGATLP